MKTNYLLPNRLKRIGPIFIAFSKEKSEDEYIFKIRLDSLVWATYLNYLIVILAIIFVYDYGFYWVLLFNMFTILFFLLSDLIGLRLELKRKFEVKNNIKVDRAKNNIMKAQLAKLVNLARQTINAIELGKYNLSTILALKIAHVINQSVSS